MIPLSTDLSERNKPMDYLQENFPNNIPTNPGLKEVTVKRLPQQSLYLLFIKEFVNDSALYENPFETLRNLRLVLNFNFNQVPPFVITNVSYNNSIIKQQTYFTLLHFLFSDFEYQILDNERINLTGRDFIQQALKDYHDSPMEFNGPVPKLNLIFTGTI